MVIRFVPHDGPVPFDPFIDRLGQTPDLDLVGMVAVEEAGREQHARDQQGACRRSTARSVPNRWPVLHVEEMVEEALVARRRPSPRGLGAGRGRSGGCSGSASRASARRHPAPLDPDRPAGQGETRQPRPNRRTPPASGRASGRVVAVRDMDEPVEGAPLKLIDLGIQPDRCRAASRPEPSSRRPKPRRGGDRRPWRP